jgi:hypothetical protein
MCRRWSRLPAGSWLSNVSPQTHLISELGFCVGIFSPRFHIAYFRSVQSRKGLKLGLAAVRQVSIPCGLERRAGRPEHGAHQPHRIGIAMVLNEANAYVRVPEKITIDFLRNSWIGVQQNGLQHVSLRRAALVTSSQIFVRRD